MQAGPLREDFRNRTLDTFALNFPLTIVKLEGIATYPFLMP